MRTLLPSATFYGMLVELQAAHRPQRVLTEGSPKMLRCLNMATWAVLVAATFAAAAAETAGADEISKAAEFWQQMSSAEPDTADYKEALWKLTALIGTTDKARHIEMATAMMDRSSHPGVNEAALRLFGADPFDPAEIGKILADPQRSYEQRELLKTYYGECKPTGTASLLSEPVRRKLVEILADRLDKLAGTPMHYGEQRLFVHLVSTVLDRCPASSQAEESLRLVKAMEKYAEKAPASDTLGAAIPVWLDLRKSPVADITNFS